MSALATGKTVIVICGGGSIPFAVADALEKQGRRAFLYALKGWADPAKVAHYPHVWGSLGQFGRFLQVARREDCRDVVFIGTLVRPALTELRLDWTTLRLLPRIARLFFGGDDHLLSGIARIFEEHGLHVMAAHEIAPQIIIPEGALTMKQPSQRDQQDIARGLALLKATASFDIGQAVVVVNNHVVAIEAAEGTDQMLARVAELRKNGRLRAPAGTGVLIKAPKRDQDRRLDLPSIGPQTIEIVAAAGLAGVAVTAGSTIVADVEHVKTIAEKADVFVIGLHESGDA